MFNIESLNIVEESFRPVNDFPAEQNVPAEQSLRQPLENNTSAGRGELFVLAANIYYRARKNTRARAAGIL